MLFNSIEFLLFFPIVLLVYFVLLSRLNRVLGTLKMEKLTQLDILLPVGISFFTFQALGYTIDVYRGEVKAEKNLFKYALFVSFFPQLWQGLLRDPKTFWDRFVRSHRVGSGIIRE